MANRKKKKDRAAASGSGNVFADVGVRAPVEKQTKVLLAVTINNILEQSRLTQTAAARRLGISQPKVSALANYRLEGFSVERLLNLLNALGRDVEIVIRRRRQSSRAARVHVVAA
jgi:predicted XRE-type DNA-binding protein